jgi:hypothetical protein
MMRAGSRVVCHRLEDKTIHLSAAIFLSEQEQEQKEDEEEDCCRMAILAE